MASGQEWEKFFKDDKFAKNYKTGERVTEQFAQALIDQSGLILESRTQQDAPHVVLDNACGTGIVSSLLHHQLDDKVKRNWKLTCGDISEGMLRYTKLRMENEHWQNAETKLVDAQATQLPDAHYTHVFTAFGESPAMEHWGYH
jgi:ubiquinone/menaquinone biosynthesis C-methylase UbiE